MTYSNYKIYPDGRVWDTLRDKYMTQYTRGGYMFVCIKNDDGGWRSEYIHRLVGETYIPNPDNLPVILHLDDNPTNNDVSNLRWGTQRDNVRDMVNKGRRGTPKRSRYYKLLSPEGEVYETHNLREFSEMMGLPKDCLNGMYNGRQGRTQYRGWRRHPDTLD